MKLARVRGRAFPDKLIVQVGVHKRLYVPATPRGSDGRIMLPPDFYPEGSEEWLQATMESPHRSPR